MVAPSGCLSHKVLEVKALLEGGIGILGAVVGLDDDDLVGAENFSELLGRSNADFICIKPKVDLVKSIEKWEELFW